MGGPNTSGGIEIDPKALKHPTLAFLREYWEGLRHGRAMPSRADIKPSQMKDHLSWLVLLDVIDGGRDFRYRLIGDDVAEYFAWNPTGMTVSESFATQPDALRDVVLAVYRSVVHNRVPVRAFGNAGWATEHVERVEALYVPLSDDGKTVNHLLHAFVFDRSEVRVTRQMARANGGKLVERPTR